MKTLNCKLQTLNFLKLFAFLFVFIILHFKVLSFNLPSVSAQSRLIYPIPDLGYCRDAKECSLYCEIPQNKAACWSYGKYKLGPQVLGVSTMSEEEIHAMRQKAKEYGITFPIADLGNCAGPAQCRDFCEQPANQTTCIAFAKKKGFDKEMERSDGMDPGKRDDLLQQAKNELGCTSMESCSKVCETDHSRCETFARKHGVYQEPPQMQLMEKAKSELGCTSMESCSITCEKNPQRCMEFAKKHGFDKRSGQGEGASASANYGIQKFGKGNCDSEESCKRYCQNHPNECPGFQGYTRATQGGAATDGEGKNYVGPSGCRTEEECKQYCEKNPTTCPGFSESQDYKHFVEGKNRAQSETKQGYRTYEPTPYSTQTQQFTLPQSTTSQYSAINSYPPQEATSQSPYPSPFTSPP